MIYAYMHDLHVRVHVYGPMAILTECSESAVLAIVTSGVHVFTEEPVRHIILWGSTWIVMSKM